MISDGLFRRLGALTSTKSRPFCADIQTVAHQIAADLGASDADIRRAIRFLAVITGTDDDQNPISWLAKKERACLPQMPDPYAVVSDRNGVGASRAINVGEGDPPKEIPSQIPPLPQRAVGVFSYQMGYWIGGVERVAMGVSHCDPVPVDDYGVGLSIARHIGEKV